MSETACGRIEKFLPDIIQPYILSMRLSDTKWLQKFNAYRKMKNKNKNDTIQYAHNISRKMNQSLKSINYIGT